MSVNGLEKNVLLDSIEVLKFCKSVGIDLNKLKSCRIEKMFDEYVFGLIKKNYDDNEDPEWYLREDLSTQPDIVLVVACNDGKVVVKATDKTHLLR